MSLKFLLSAALIATLQAVLPAQAQVRLPSLPGLPGQPGGPHLPGDLLRRTESLLTSTSQLLVPADPLRWRERLGDQLLRRFPDQLQRNAAEELVFSGEVLALPSSDAAKRRLLEDAGLTLVEVSTLEGLDLAWLRLRATSRMTPAALAALIARLKADDPDGAYDYHHVYLDAGEVGATGPTGAIGTRAGSTSTAAGADAAGAAASAAGPRLGMIDSGVDTAHPALQRSTVTRRGCGGQARPAAHGTAVASLLVGDSDVGFRGALPRARLFAMDVYCEGGAQAGGGVAAIAEGLAWLARERVGVVNISLVGPPNALLRRVVEAAQAQGLLIVAPVGNDGPAAPPLYPAAWPGVIGVTAVDARRRVLVEAVRGAQVAFAAPGSDMVAAEAGSRVYAPVRGTSFASPLVAGMLAARFPSADRAAASSAFNALAREAIDLGAPGRDEVYGIGLVGASLRVSASDLR
ncbi:S8 family serine peptidase [Roseateles sp. So40a]|uniref:S8 family serine peptidase n=1 Tax=Roseateles sp. So40a TaxID=3400226 RepID=UPI003A8583B7